MKVCPCTSSTWRYATPDETLLTHVVVTIHNLPCQLFVNSIRTNIPGTKFPLLTKPHNYLHGWKFQVYPITPSTLIPHNTISPLFKSQHFLLMNTIQAIKNLGHAFLFIYSLMMIQSHSSPLLLILWNLLFKLLVVQVYAHHFANSSLSSLKWVVLTIEYFLKALAPTLALTRLWRILISSFLSNSNHLIFLRLISFLVNIYWKLLWSVNISSWTT